MEEWDCLTTEFVGVLRESPVADVTLWQISKISYRVKREKNPCKLPKSREDVFQCLRIMNTRTEKNEELSLYEDKMCGFIIFSTLSNLMCLVDSKFVYIDEDYQLLHEVFCSTFYTAWVI
uniref:Uncharacterized protein n=1 Tax=Lygus hesperus TaxID=30085 RepID=A0A146M9Y8_LYGHE